MREGQKKKEKKKKNLFLTLIRIFSYYYSLPVVVEMKD